MRTAILENNHLKVVVLVDSGARIIEFLYKPSYGQFMWEKPRGTHERPIYGAPLETYWGGGWDDAIPTVHPCIYKGGNLSRPWRGLLPTMELLHN